MHEKSFFLLFVYSLYSVECMIMFEKFLLPYCRHVKRNRKRNCIKEIHLFFERKLKEFSILIRSIYSLHSTPDFLPEGSMVTNRKYKGVDLTV